MSNKKFFYFVSDFKTINEQSENTSITNDILYFIKQDNKGEVVVIKKRNILFYNGLILVTNQSSSPRICTPNDSIFFLENSGILSLEEILLHKGFISESCSLSRKLAQNKSLSLYYLKSNNFPILNYSVSTPLKDKPFIAKKWNHTNGDGVNLCESDKEFYHRLSSDDGLIAEEYIKKEIQCSYKVLMYLQVPVGVALRISRKNEFCNKMWREIVIPLAHRKKIDKIPVFSFNQTYAYSNDIVEERNPLKEEIKLIRKALVQEKIKINKSKIPKFKSSSLLPLANKVARFFNLGRCEIDFIKHNEQYYILDVQTEISKLWKKYLGFKSNSNLIYDGLKRYNFFDRKSIPVVL